MPKAKAKVCHSKEEEREVQFLTLSMTEVRGQFPIDSSSRAELRKQIMTLPMNLILAYVVQEPYRTSHGSAIKAFK